MADSDHYVKRGALELEWVGNKPGKKGSLRVVIDRAKKAGHNVVLACDVYGSAKMYASAVLAHLPGQLPDFNGYESLQEEDPRHFYIDLEAPSIVHPDVDVLLGNVHRVVEQGLAMAHPDISYDRAACVQLDATGIAQTGSFKGKHKLSRHIKFPFIFANHAGAREFATLVHSISMAPENVSTLTFWDTTLRAHRSVIDPSPYTRNQCFRLAYQTKKGDEGRPLVPVGDCVDWRDHLVRYTGPPCPVLSAQASIAINDARALAAEEFGNRTSRNDIITFVGAGLAGEPDWDAATDDEFYMSCIGNSPAAPQPRNVFFAVACALKNIGAQFSMFAAWCEKRGPSITNGVYRRNTWDKLEVRPRSYGLPFLKRAAEKCFPGCERSRTNQALQSIMRVKCPDSIVREIYDRPYVKPYNLAEYEIAMEKSAMGTGKTLKVERYIESDNPTRVAALSPRCIFAESLTARFSKFDFECYSAHAGNSIDSLVQFRAIPRLVIQMESLHKLADYEASDGATWAALKQVEPFDLVIIDEAESCLKQYSSEKTMTRLKRCGAALEQMLRRAKKILLLDAFISQRTIATLASILGADFGGRRVIYRENTHVPIECRRIAYDCAGISRTPAKFGKSSADAAKNDLTFVLMKKLEEGKRVVFVNASKAYAQMVVDEVKARFPQMSVRVYAGDGDDTMDRDIRDVNLHWAGVQLLMYTSRITVGVNYDNAVNAFDCLLVYGSSWSCNVRDVFQSTMRVRTLNEKAMYYALYDDAKAVPMTVMAIKDRIACVRAANLEMRVRWEEAPPWLEQLHVMNTLEDNVHAGSYRAAFNQYLDITGYERKTLDCISRDALPDVPDIEGIREFKDMYEEMPNLGFEEASDLRNKICAKEASAKDKACFKRYIFQTKMDANEGFVAFQVAQARKANEKEATPGTVAELERLEKMQVDTIRNHARAWSLFCSNDAHVIDHVYLEKNETGEGLAQKKRLANPYSSLVGDEPATLDAIQRICRALGLQTTHDTAVEIEADVIVSALKEREADVALLRKLLALRDRSESDGKIVQGECAHARDTFSAIFNAWSGAKLKPAGKRRQKTVGGKRMSVQNYGVSLDEEIQGIEQLLRKRDVTTMPANPAAAMVAALATLAV